jgi:MFS family permease
MTARDTWVLVATIVGSSLVFIDGAVVTLALPQIQAEFGKSAADIAWIVESYTLVLGALMLLGGALADRYGRKRIFMSGALLFAAGSIGCAIPTRPRISIGWEPRLRRQRSASRPTRSSPQCRSRSLRR